MTIDTYLNGLVRRLPILFLLAAIGFGSAFLYFAFNSRDTARVTVAAIEPALTRAANGGGQAQITFDSILSSQALAQRVLDRLDIEDMTAKSLSDNISVRLATTLIPNVVTPLYMVDVKDSDPDRALLLANTAADEAQTLFLELNSLDRVEYRSIFDEQLVNARSDVEINMERLQDFKAENGLYSLSEQIGLQVLTLRELLAEDRHETASQKKNIQLEEARLANLELIGERRAAAVESLRVLGVREADYNLLLFELDLAQNLLSQVTSTDTQLNLGAALQSFRSGVRTTLPSSQQTSPSDLETVVGSVPIVGSATDPNFWKYEIQIAPVAQPDQWRLLGVFENPVQDGTLATWDTTNYADGSYNIRIRTVRRDANYTDAYIRQVWVDNSGRGRQDGLQPISNSTQPAGLFEGSAVTQPSLDRAASLVGQAKANLTTFQLTNDATALAARVNSQVQIVAELDRAERAALETLELARAARIAQEENLVRVTFEIREARRELDRLVSLQPKYETIQLDLQLAEATLALHNSALQQRIIQETNLGTAQVKILDDATLQPKGITALVILMMSTLVGVVAALLLIYLLIYFDRNVYDESDAEALIQAPVLTTIPSA